MHRLAAGLDAGVRAVLRPVVFGAMAALVVVITLQIVTRVFFTATSWTEEVARYLLVWLTFLGATLALAEGRHIAVTLLLERLPVRLRGALVTIAHLSAALFLGALALVAWRYMGMSSFQRSAALRIPMFWVYAVIPVAAGLMALISLLRTAADRQK